jgi:hypothetical protein
MRNLYSIKADELDHASRRVEQDHEQEEARAQQLAALFNESEQFRSWIHAMNAEYGIGFAKLCVILSVGVEIGYALNDIQRSRG